MEGDSTVPLLFWPKTAGQSLQCADGYYCGEKRTSNLSTFLASHGQYAYTNSPKLEHMAFIIWSSDTYLWWITPLLSKNKISMVFTLDFLNQNFLEGSVFGQYHLELWRFVSRSYAKHQLSSPVIIESKKFRSLLIVLIRS